MEDIDQHIAELEHRISHDSLSLNEEKRVMEQVGGRQLLVLQLPVLLLLVLLALTDAASSSSHSCSKQQAQEQESTTQSDLACTARCAAPCRRRCAR